MGVDVTTHWMFGWKYGYKQFKQLCEANGIFDTYDDPASRPFAEGAPEAGKRRIIMDGMGGKYVIVGLEIGKFDQMSGDGDEFIAMKPEDLVSFVKETYDDEWIIKILGKDYHEASEEGLVMYCFNHYS